MLEQIEHLQSLHRLDGETALERQLALHLQAKVMLAGNDPGGAYAVLQQILADEQAPVPVLLYNVLHDMEQCCKALDDYKGAYEHALHKLSVHQRLLTERTV